MSASPTPYDLGLAWLTYATEDLACADMLAGAYRRPAAYHCQQAAEKSMKALLALADVPFRPTHDLREIGQAVATVYPELAELVRKVAPWLRAALGISADALVG